MNTANDIGRLLITVLGMVADMELRFIKERQRAGIVAAKKRSTYKGRKKAINEVEIRRLDRAGVPKARISRDLNISRTSIYGALNASALPETGRQTNAHRLHSQRAHQTRSIYG